MALKDPGYEGETHDKDTCTASFTGNNMHFTFQICLVGHKFAFSILAHKNTFRIYHTAAYVFRSSRFDF